MLWNSYPIIFFIRDGLRIGPQGSLFTIAYWAIGFLLMWPGNLFSRLYNPNPLLLFFWGGFISLSCIYWQYYSPNPIGDGSREFLTYTIPFVFLFLLMYYPNDKVDCILVVMVFYGLFASTGLIYHISTSPNWHLGERAGISYAAMESNSNPHTFANNAFATIIASVILLWKTRSIALKVFYLIAVIFSFAVMILCRTNTSLITLGVALVVAVIFNARAIAKAAFSFKSLKVGFGLYVVIALILAQFGFVGSVLSNYSSAFTQRFNRVLYTAFGAEVGMQNGGGQIDHSASYRVESIKRTKEFLLSSKTPIGEVLMGQGYKSAFMDMPSLDAIVNQGVLGFLFYNGFWLMIIFTMIQQYVRPANNLSLFIAYFSLLLLLFLASGGQAVDISAWLLQAFFIRFLGVYPTKSNPELQLA
ncbi:MAG: hypothetical protein EAZ67_13550 [Cytophagales bacterium]|nr:MAG: hypothetical protein EAZ67_13550 [Cytophagales bacterium]